MNAHLHNKPSPKISVAPMMDWTDRHCRYFHRLLAPDARLYTEMVTTGAVLNGDRERLLGFDPVEQPVALQLGGSDPDELARCAVIAEQWGYNEVNLNVGCPSDRVQKGRFGACLMKEPGLVSECLTAMAEAVGVPVTIKTRLGVDELYSYEYFSDFVQQVMQPGVAELIAHARKAELKGLSPKENRDVPPLHHDWVYRLKEARPEMHIQINGGIDTVEKAAAHLEKVDGVMLGRAAYHNPWILAELQSRFGEAVAPARPQDLIEPMTVYLQQQVEKGVAVKHITRHVLGLFQGRPGARIWRRYISENAHRDDRAADILECAFAAMPASGKAA